MVQQRFDAGASAVVLDGQEGIGKTTLLAQYAKERADRCISLFVRPAHRWSNDPGSVLDDLAAQASLLLDRDITALPAEQPISRVQRTLNSLGRKLASRGNTCLLVVDGLFDDASDAQQTASIVELLPLGNQHYRFLFAASGRTAQLRELGIDATPVPVPGLSVEETKFLLSRFPDVGSKGAEFFDLTGGIPGLVAGVARLLSGGMRADQLLKEKPSTLTTLFDLEWRALTTSDPWHRTLLGVLVHDQKRHTVIELARIVEVTPAAIEEFVAACPLLEATDDGEVRFHTELVRQVGASRLKAQKGDIFRLLISDLTAHADKRQIALHLARYYEQSDDFGSVVSTLSPAFLLDALSSTNSVNIVIQHAALGVSASEGLKRPEEAVRFRLGGAALADATAASGSDTEIRALVAVGRHAEAIGVARSARLREKRFQGLAAVAAATAASGVTVGDDLVGEIRHMANEIDLLLIKDDAIGVAAALIDVAPDVSVGIVERLASSGMDRRALDESFLRLTAMAHLGAKETDERASALAEVRRRIGDPRLRGMSEIWSYVTTKTIAGDAIAHAQTIEKADDRLFFLRTWLSQHSRRSDALRVSTFALNEAVRAGEVSLSGGVLRQLAEPLRYCDDGRECLALVKLFDAHRVAVEEMDPSVEVIRLRLLLARAIARTDVKDAERRLEEVYRIVDSLTDPALKLAGLAHVLDSLPNVSPETAEEERGKSELATQIRGCAAVVASVSAEQEVAVREAVGALAARHPDLALELCDLLNTESRRDDARAELARALVAEPSAAWNLGVLDSTVTGIKRRLERHRIVAAVVEALADQCRRGVEDGEKAAVLATAKRIGSWVSQIEMAELKAAALTGLLGVFRSCGNDHESGLRDGLSRELDRTIDGALGRARADIAYESAAALGLQWPERARDLIDRVAEQGSRRSPDVEQTCVSLLRLAVRAFRGMSASGWVEADQEQLLDLIGRLDGPIQKAGLYSDLAVSLWSRRKLDTCNGVVNKHLLPLIVAVGQADAELRDLVVWAAAPALYLAAPAEAKRLLGTADWLTRQWAWRDVAVVRLSRLWPDEPKDSQQKKGFRLEISDATEALDAIRNVEHDGMLNELVEMVVDCLRSDVNRSSLTGGHRTDLLTRLRAIVEERLPAKRGIQHDGYKIVSNATLLAAGRSAKADWVALRDDARLIANIADRAFVLASLAEKASIKDGSFRAETFAEAEQLIDRISVSYDRVARCQDLGSMLREFDPVAAKRLLERGLRGGLDLTGADGARIQRSIIDVAYKMDPELARSLASIADADPARVAVRARLQERLRQLDVRKKLTDRKAEQVEDERDAERHARVARELLGSLNAGSLSARRLSELSLEVAVAGKLGIVRGYWLWAWVIENLAVLYGSTNESRRFLRPVFDGCVFGVEMLKTVESGHLGGTPGSDRAEGESIVRAGERDKALQHIKSWCEEFADDHLLICDPYFGAHELEHINVWRSALPNLRFTVITSEKHLKDNDQLGSGAFRDAWRRSVSIEEPPDVYVVVAGEDGTGKLPIHDRYILATRRGLRLGSSLNSLGISQDSSIATLLDEDLAVAWQRASLITERKQTTPSGKRIRYESFTL